MCLISPLSSEGLVAISRSFTLVELTSTIRPIEPLDKTIQSGEYQPLT